MKALLAAVHESACGPSATCGERTHSSAVGGKPDVPARAYANQMY